MSIITCHDCCKNVDTDFHPVEWIEIGNMRRQTQTVVLCEACFERRIDDLDRAAYEEGFAMEQAEKEGLLE